ncbi:MAG: hypothetical protein QMC80_01960 [Thermoplasmatales archaeon]|nr:hypothetical protein [Thermoplasmatales archaeon]
MKIFDLLPKREFTREENIVITGVLLIIFSVTSLLYFGLGVLWPVYYIASIMFHEGGHMIVAIIIWLLSTIAGKDLFPALEFWFVAGGTIFELAFPIILFLVHVRRKKDFSLASIFLCCLGTAIIFVGTYMATAPTPTSATSFIGREMTPTTHDWHYLFNYFNAMHMAIPLSSFLKDFGLTLIFVGGISGIVEFIRLILKKSSHHYSTVIAYGAIPATLIMMSTLRWGQVGILFLLILPATVRYLNMRYPEQMQKFCEKTYLNKIFTCVKNTYHKISSKKPHKIRQKAY